MPAPTKERPRPRPERRTTRKVIPLDLFGEARAMKQEKAWLEHGHDAKMLYRREQSRAVLVVLRAGTRIPKHDVDAGVILQPMESRVRVHLPDDFIDLGPGSILSIDRHVPFDIEARSNDLIMLMTFSL